jgi:hypothetical protein
MKNTSWNNIPLPLKEMIQALMNAHIKQEAKMKDRKSINNKRFIKLQSKVKQLQT